MAFIDLPSEIVQAILDCLDNVRDLAECRLVCKAWDPISEQLMFGKNIILTSKANLLQLVQHLNKSSSFGALVRYVNFGVREIFPAEDLYSKLFSLIFTPNLRVLDGYIPIKNIYKKMVSVASKSTRKFDKLEVIPHGENIPMDSSDFTAACLFFKQSLKMVTVTINHENKTDWGFIGKLGTFDNLAHLTISMGMTDLDTIRRIIDNCNELESLKLSWVDVKNPQLTKADVQNWFRINDKPKKQMKALSFLKVENCFSPVFIEYLVYKFQSIKAAEIDMSMYQAFINADIMRVTDERIRDDHIRVVEALKDIIFFYDFKYSILRNNRLVDIMSHAQGMDNVISIKTINPRQGLIHMRLQKFWQPGA